jgi:hypothetical protein
MEHREDKGEHDQSMKATPPSFTIVITPHRSNMLVLSSPCKMLQRGKTGFNFFYLKFRQLYYYIITRSLTRIGMRKDGGS